MESSIDYFSKRGYHVTFLTTCEKGSLHFALEKKGISAEQIKLSSTSKLFYYFGLIRFLVKYSRKNNIHFIHSHLQIPNLISCISGFFIKAKVFNVRHNSDVIELNGSLKEKLIEKVINLLSSHIIAISDKVRDQLINKENVNPGKVYRINNGYDFKEYDKLSEGIENSLKIKAEYNNSFLILSPGRLIKTKRHDLTILAMKVFRDKGLQIKLLILGNGPEEEALKKLITKDGLEDYVFLAGYHENISDYLKAADVVALLSESEASNNAIKEAGYFKKTVIACENVGDFSDYIRSGENGYLVNKKDPLTEFIDLIGQLYNNRVLLNEKGDRLKETIIKEFDIESVGKKYEELQNNLIKK
jgi:glycosyltransferase involved in cell wall biosynthesis